MVTYDPANQELRTVPEAFAARTADVDDVVWEPGIETGTDVAPGKALVVVWWSDKTKDLLFAPAGCKGCIADLNRKIVYERLKSPPSQWLLRLVPGGGA